jgi:tetratricopeptide (TPR) repeat protein
VDIYEKLLDEAGQDAVFLLFELGRARAASAVRAAGEQAETLRREAVDALESFNERIPGGVAEGLCAAAWNELAQIHIEMKDDESAEDALMRAQEAVPGQPIAYLNLGLFLKQAGRVDEAVEALEQGAEVMDKLRPDFRLLAELGLSYREVERVDEAMETLQMVVEGMVQLHHGHHDPYVVVPLAEMYEQKGRVREACDLYRHVAEGTDGENLGLYSYHSARLLGELGDDETAMRYLARARELATDEDLRKKLDGLGGGQTP